MNKLEELRKIYEDTAIPKDLSKTVQTALQEGLQQKSGTNTTDLSGLNEKTGKKATQKIRRRYRTVATTAAALLLAFGIFSVTVQTNEAFADSVSDLPLLGNLVRVLTGVQMDESDSAAHIEMTLPKVEGLTDKKTEKRINQEINDKMAAIVADSKQRALEDKKAYLETGGKESDFIPREIIVNYEVKNISAETLSFVVRETETAANAYTEEFYYNIDLTSNQDISLESYLGPDYKESINAQIKEEIVQRSKEKDAVYWDGSDGIEGFSSISDNQNFYINESGNVVIVFNKYEIAPGYMGMQEFEIK